MIFLGKTPLPVDEGVTVCGRTCFTFLLRPCMTAILQGMRHRDLFGTFWRDLSCSNRLDPLECLREIEAITARVTDTNGHIFKDDKTCFVLKRFAFHALCAYRPLTVFTPITELCRH